MSSMTEQYAQSGDWDAHQATISDLYQKQKKSLKAVMQIMRDDHNFRATYVYCRYGHSYLLLVTDIRDSERRCTRRASPNGVYRRILKLNKSTSFYTAGTLATLLTSRHLYPLT